MNDERPESPNLKKKRGKGAPLGNKNANIIDKLTDKQIEDIKEHYYEHLAMGFPIHSFHYKISYKTLQKLIENRPDIFDEEGLEMIKSKRYHTMISIGMGQAQGTIEKGNPQAWKVLMANMYGWSDKVQTKQEISLEDQFRKAVLAHQASELSEVEEDEDL